MNTQSPAMAHEAPGRFDRLLPLRSVPAGGLGQAVASTLDSMRQPVLVERLTDRLSSSNERLALYTTLLAKAVAAGDACQLDLESMIRDERVHAAIIRRHLDALGIDPAFAPPPRESEPTRVLQIIADSRTTVSQSLCALLGATLAAVGEWETMSRTARDAREHAMAADFDGMRSTTESHVHRIRVRGDRMMQA